MILNTSIVGLSSSKASGTPVAPGGIYGEILDSRLAPDLYTLTKYGRVFYTGGASLNPAAFVGGAAGTPLIGLYNPINSGVDLVLLFMRMNIRTTGSAAQTAQGFSFWSAPQAGVVPSGTQTPAKSVYSMQSGASAAYCMINVANTGAAASTIVAPSFSVGNVGATPGVNVGSLVDEIKGAIIVSQGTYLAYGAFQAMTAGQLDVSLFWAEMPA